MFGFFNFQLVEFLLEWKKVKFSFDPDDGHWKNDIFIKQALL